MRDFGRRVGVRVGAVPRESCIAASAAYAIISSGTSKQGWSSVRSCRLQTGRRSIELQWHAPGAAHLARRPGYSTVEREVGDTPEPLLKRDLQLHAGEIGPYPAV